MKKQVLLFLVVFDCMMVFAQKKVNEYSMEYFKNNPTYDIEATEPKNGKFTFYIYGCSLDAEKEVGFSVESKDLEKFVESLRSIEDKFEEWTKTAKDNNVTDYDKNFDAKFKSVRVFFKYGSKYHSTYVKFSPYFKVTKNGECIAVFRTRELTASDNQFMHHDGFMLAFSSKQEIEDFIKALDPNPILSKESKNEATDNLFK